MKIKIDQYGTLWFERPRGWVKQVCPYATNSCGDWCPLFGEPSNGEIVVCSTVWEGEIVDERVATGEVK